MQATMHAAIRGSREHIPVEIDDAESPTAEEAFEKSTLTIDQSKEKTVKDVWQRASRKPLPTKEGIFTNFEVQFARIIPNEGDSSNTKKYVAYDITGKQDTSTTHDKFPVTIERRYTDFLKLFESLKKSHPLEMANAPPCPGKKIIGNFTNELISQRAMSFENLLDYFISVNVLRDSEAFLSFIQDEELNKACQLCDERRNELAIPIFENVFQMVNKVYLDRSRQVLLVLLRLVAACTTSPIPHPSAEKWIDLALRRFDHVSDVDMLVLYVPLLNSASYLFWQKGRDDVIIKERIESLQRQGIKTKDTLTLTQAIHTMDTRSETF